MVQLEELFQEPSKIRKKSVKLDLIDLSVQGSVRKDKIFIQYMYI